MADTLAYNDFIAPARHKMDERLLGKVPLDNAPGDSDSSWRRIFDAAEKYDLNICRSYKQHIDTVLVFAGLFSAVVTAFTVESYQWLHDDAGDATVKLLSQLAGVAAPETSALSEAQKARINIFWFLALLLGLSAAFLALLARQWIAEFERRLRHTVREGLAVRQVKFKGLDESHVKDFSSTYPLLLLQVALALFFVGILQLLWTLNKLVATPIIAVSAALASIYVCTTLLPSVQFAQLLCGWMSEGSICAYQSPQAWLALKFIVGMVYHIRRMSRLAMRRDDRENWALKGLWEASSWIEYAYAWTRLDIPARSGRLPRLIGRAAHAIRRRFGRSSVDLEMRLDHHSETWYTPAQFREYSVIPARSQESYAFDAILSLKATLDGSDLAVPILYCVWDYLACVDPEKGGNNQLGIAKRMGFLEGTWDIWDPLNTGDQRRSRRDDHDRRDERRSRRDEHDPRDEMLKPWLILVRLCFEQELAPALLFELLFLIQTIIVAPHSRSHATRTSHSRITPEWMMSLVRAADNLLSPKNVDIKTCQHLLALLSEKRFWKLEQDFVAATVIGLRVLSLVDGIPSLRLKGLAEDICLLLETWLRQWGARPGDLGTRTNEEVIYGCTQAAVTVVTMLAVNAIGTPKEIYSSLPFFTALVKATAHIDQEIFRASVKLIAPSQVVYDVLNQLVELDTEGIPLNPVRGGVYAAARGQSPGRFALAGPGGALPIYREPMRAPGDPVSGHSGTYKGDPLTEVGVAPFPGDVVGLGLADHDMDDLTLLREPHSAAPRSAPIGTGFQKGKAREGPPSPASRSVDTASASSSTRVLRVAPVVEDARPANRDRSPAPEPAPLAAEAEWPASRDSSPIPEYGPLPHWGTPDVEDARSADRDRSPGPEPAPLAAEAERPASRDSSPVLEDAPLSHWGPFRAALPDERTLQQMRDAVIYALRSHAGNTEEHLDQVSAPREPASSASANEGRAPLAEAAPAPSAPLVAVGSTSPSSRDSSPGLERAPSPAAPQGPSSAALSDERTSQQMRDTVLYALRSHAGNTEEHLGRLSPPGDPASSASANEGRVPLAEAAPAPSAPLAAVGRTPAIDKVQRAATPASSTSAPASGSVRESDVERGDGTPGGEPATDEAPAARTVWGRVKSALRIFSYVF